MDIVVLLISKYHFVSKNVGDKVSKNKFSEIDVCTILFTS